VWLDFVEHSYLERAAWVRLSQIVDVLEQALRRLDPTAVFAPFGLGNPDHDATHQACLLARDRLTPSPAWFCYEDTGYKHIPGLLAWRVSKLLRAGVWPTPAAVPIEVDHQQKLAAYACYATQVRALEAEWNLSPKLAAPAPEQYSRLAPPPAGWERLADR
jgi:LmbE family N-acetylglucosaminyl deacetylase